MAPPIPAPGTSCDSPAPAAPPSATAGRSTTWSGAPSRPWPWCWAGLQSLTVNTWQEAFEIPDREAMHLAPRTQQIVAYESGIADTADPWPAPTSWRA
jgi:hypothetical protein